MREISFLIYKTMRVARGKRHSYLPAALKAVAFLQAQANFYKLTDV